MKQNTNLLILVLLLFFHITSCNNKAQNTEETGRTNKTPERNAVKIMVLKQQAFQKQLTANGKLSPLQKSDLLFKVSGEIAKLPVHNGTRVSRGGLIAALNDAEYRHQLQQARTNLKKAELELQDVLIGMGYSLNDSLLVPIEKMELARIRSGYSDAMLDFESAQRNLNNCSLFAPFGGIVANISQQKYEQTTGTPFCTLIDDSKFEAVFQIIESEIEDVAVNDIVKVQPFAFDTVCYGKITEINPVIDQNGLLQVKAVVDNPGMLIDGMNVQVLIEKEVPGQFVVPKSAVVLRDNFEVLFKVVNGKAYWNYIQCTMENSTSYAVIPHPDKNTASLASGDTIIISGNLNLAHESEVSF